MRSANILISICKEIAKDCADKNIAINEEFIEFYVKLIILDPVWNVSLVSDEIIRVNVQNLIKNIVYKLNFPRCPCMIAMRMQLYMRTNYDILAHIVPSSEKALRDRLSPLENDILDSPMSITDEDDDLLYKKIVYYITLMQGLGNPTIQTVFNEAKQALFSIMGTDDLHEFCMQSMQNRINDIQELSHIVVGIRLFNRDCKKGGRGIEDLPTLLKESLQLITKEIQDILLFTMENVNLITTAIEECIKTEWKETIKNYVIYYELPDGVDYEDFEYAKDVLLAYRQYEIYLRQILSEIDKIDESVKELFECFTISLNDIHECVDCKYAVLTDVVFPKFICCAELWRKLQNETIFLARINEIYLHIQTEINQLIPNSEVLKAMLGNALPISDEDRLKLTMGYAIEQAGNQTTVLLPPTMETRRRSFNQLELEYLGFCAWKLTETQGGLIPGNPNIGICKYKSRYYSFSSLEAAVAFGNEPEKFVKQAIELCRKKPELVNLLNLEDQVEMVQHAKVLYVQPKPPILKMTRQLQTEVHITPTYLKTHYKWNIWDYKRQAIKMANISKMKSHSTQTDKSNNANAIRTQTYENKEQTTQTKRDNYSNVPTLSNFIYGLRGRKDNNQQIIQLTRPVSEK